MNPVEEYIARHRPLQQKIMSVLRSWILDLGAHTEEKIKYKIPYFNHFGTVAYLKPTVDGVDLGLIEGKSLSRSHKMVLVKGSKSHGYIRFHSLAELEEQEDEIRKILNDAAIMNRYLDQQKKKA